MPSPTTTAVHYASTHAHSYSAPALVPLPPTSNTLDAHQRTRLIRSTRKLGAVLGTTPRFLDDLPRPPASAPNPPLLPIQGRRSPPASALRKTSAYAKRRQGSVFELPPPSSAATFYDSGSASSSASSLSLSRSSLESTTSLESAASSSSLPATKSFTRGVRDRSRAKGTTTPLPAPLVLRLHAVPLPPSDPRLHHPSTPDSSASLSFAKASTPAASSSSALSPGMLPTTPTTPRAPSPAETRRKRLAKLKRTLGDNVPPELVIPGPEFSSGPAMRTRTRRPSTSTSPVTPVVSPPAPLALAAPPALLTPRARKGAAATSTLPRPKGARRRSMSVDFAAVSQTSESGTESGEERRSSRVWVTGNGTWTGEWNRRDIREVQQQLRALRAR